MVRAGLIGIYLTLCLGLLMMQDGLLVCGKLFFSQDVYNTIVSPSHPIHQPVAKLRIYHNYLHGGEPDCVIVNDQQAAQQFRLEVLNATLVRVMLRNTLRSSQERHEFVVTCRGREQRVGHVEPRPTSTDTTVTVTVTSCQQQHSEMSMDDICFSHFPALVRIRENSTGIVGTDLWMTLSAQSGCKGQHESVTYSLGDQTGVGLRVDAEGRLWVMEPLDYETNQQLRVPIMCQIITQDGAGDRELRPPTTRQLMVQVVNINDVSPYHRGKASIKKHFNSTSMAAIRKVHILDQYLVFDEDGDEFLPQGRAFTQGDGLRQFSCSLEPIKIGSTVGAYVAIRWEKELLIEDATYTFKVVYEDRGYKANYGLQAANRVVFSVDLDFNRDWMVRQGAQKYSRILGDLPAGSNYSITGQHNHLFAITPENGTLYVNDSTQLREITDSSVRLQVGYTDTNDKIRLTTKSITITGGDGASTQHICKTPCSQHESRGECTSSCGLGTPSTNCTWLPSCATQSKNKGLCTCTHHTVTCPDGTCDELEKLVPSLCPLDCPKGAAVVKGFYNKVQTWDNVHCWCAGQENCECTAKPDSSDKIIAGLTGVPFSPTYPTGRRLPTTAAPQCGLWCVILAVGASFIVCFIIVLMALYFRHSYRRRQDKTTPEKPLNGSVASLSATPSDYVVDTSTAELQQVQTRLTAASSHNSIDWITRVIGSPIAVDNKWEFSRKNLKLEKTLGEGEFGRVVRAQAYELDNPNEYSTVAVKMLKECATGSELRDLLSEYNLLKDVSHINVIKLLGVCSKGGGPFYLMVEFCEHGALRSYLRECRLNESYTDQHTLQQTQQEQELDSPEVTANDLLSFAWQIAKGMQYLSTMKLVHRDLAARNVLVATGKVIKISDFGLSRDIYEEDTYRKRSKGRIPVKWMAPESLYDQVYTTKSDVWSFGITLWEIVTLGATPYPGLAPERLYHRLKSGYRMEKPTHCSDQLFRVMSWCWRTLANDRPTFSQLVDTIEGMLKQHVEYLDLGGAIDRHPILDDDTMETEETTSDQEGGYGSISRLTEDNAYLNPSSHHHPGINHSNFDDIVCDDCTMRMIKEGDVTTECTKLLSHHNHHINHHPHNHLLHNHQGDPESVLTDCVNNNRGDHHINTSKNNINNSSNGGVGLVGVVGGGNMITTPRPLMYIQVDHGENYSDEDNECTVTPVLL